MRHRAAGCRKDEVNFLREQAEERRTRAFVRHAVELGFRSHHEHLARDVKRCAAGAGSVEQTARFRAGKRDELADGVHLERRMHDQHVRRALELRNRREVGENVVIGLLDERLELHRAAAHHERIAVGRRARDDAGHEPARPVIDDDLLPEHGAERRRHDSREIVVAAAWRRRDDANGTSRIVLRRRDSSCADAKKKHYGGFACCLHSGAISCVDVSERCHWT
jgi:hypothetical protein